jgi:hypothetical protein
VHGAASPVSSQERQGPWRVSESCVLPGEAGCMVQRVLCPPMKGRVHGGSVSPVSSQERQGAWCRGSCVLSEEAGCMVQRVLCPPRRSRVHGTGGPVSSQERQGPWRVSESCILPGEAGCMVQRVLCPPRIRRGACYMHTLLLPVSILVFSIFPSSRKCRDEGFQVLPPVLMKNFILWDIMPWSQLKVMRRFGVTRRLCLQDRSLVQATKQYEADGNNALYPGRSTLPRSS